MIGTENQAKIEIEEKLAALMVLAGEYKESQQVCFYPGWRFELVDSNKAAALAVA